MSVLLVENDPVIVYPSGNFKSFKRSSRVYINCSAKSQDPKKSLASLNIKIGDNSTHNSSFVSSNVLFEGNSCSGTVQSGVFDNYFVMPIVELGSGVKVKVASYMDASHYKNESNQLGDPQYPKLADFVSEEDPDPSLVRYVSFQKQSVTTVGYAIGFFSVYFKSPEFGTEYFINISWDPEAKSHSWKYKADI